MVTLYATASAVFLFVIARLLGKRQIAQLDFVDYIFGISVGSIAASWATDIDDTPFYHYLLAMVILFMFSVLITAIERKGPLAKRIFKGKPLMLIHNGEIKYKELKSAHLSVNDLIALAREQGYFDLSDIAFAIFECSGALSVLPKGEKRPAVSADVAAVLPQETDNAKLAALTVPAELPCYLIVDGKISYSGLNQLGRDTEWLMKATGATSASDLKGILLAVYSRNQLTITKKQ